MSEASFLEWTFCKKEDSVERFTNLILRSPQAGWKQINLTFTSGCLPVKSILAAALTVCAETLESFSVSIVFSFTEEVGGGFNGTELFETLRKCPNLKHIRFDGRRGSFVNPPTTALPALTSLRLFNVSVSGTKCRPCCFCYQICSICLCGLGWFKQSCGPRFQSTASSGVGLSRRFSGMTRICLGVFRRPA